MTCYHDCHAEPTFLQLSLVLQLLVKSFGHTVMCPPAGITQLFSAECAAQGFGHHYWSLGFRV